MNVLYIKIKNEKDASKIINNDNVEDSNKITNKLLKVINKFYKIIKKIFCIVDLEEIFNGYIANVPLDKRTKNIGTKKKSVSNKIINIKNYIIARKIRRIINEKNIDGIVLSDDIMENTDFLDKLILRKKQNSNLKNPFIKERKINFFNGNSLLKYIIYDVFVYIISIQERKPELEDIYILVNNIDDNLLNNIIFLSNHFRNINIVTKNIEKYRYVEETVYNNTGNYLILLNNKKKSLKRAKYIINVDFSTDELKSFSLYRKAIIINLEPRKTDAMQSFEGICINSYDIDLSNKIKEFFKKYDLLDCTNLSILYESFLNTKDNFFNVRAKIEDAGLIVTKLYGNNGIINENEYRRVNISDNEVKKYY